MQTYVEKNKNNFLRKYETGLESKAIIEELRSAPSRISDIEIGSYFASGNCPSCPSCLCTQANYLIALAPGGLAAAGLVLVACTTASFTS